MATRGVFSPSKDEITAIQNGYRGWSKVNGLGPDYFAVPAVQAELFAFITAGTPVSAETRKELARGRARTVNFFNLLAENQPLVTRPATEFDAEVTTFLAQLGEQALVWRNEAFRSLDFSRPEQEILFLVVAKSAPVLFNMGFADAIPHSAQVSRLTASMADNLGARHSKVLQAALVGWLHDPKFHPSIDLAKQNLATHPINASALAYELLFNDPALRAKTRSYFHGNTGKHRTFIEGVIDALAINNDSRFVGMMVILPAFTRQVGDLYGQEVADQFRVVIEGRLESASKGEAPPQLPDHLHGALSQFRLDSGLRGISRHGWSRVLAEAAISTGDSIALFNNLIDGEDSGLVPDKLADLKSALGKLAPTVILRADVKASTLLHHHQEVRASGRRAAEALVVADPMMLSPHKVAAVYCDEVINRIGQFIKSFDDNIRLLPSGAHSVGKRWQRVVYLSMLLAADRLTGGKLVDTFKKNHATTSLDQDIAALRQLVLQPETWGSWAQATGAAGANAKVKGALAALEACYVQLVTQYRRAVYSTMTGGELEKFYPTCCSQADSKA